MAATDPELPPVGTPVRYWPGGRRPSDPSYTSVVEAHSRGMVYLTRNESRHRNHDHIAVSHVQALDPADRCTRRGCGALKSEHDMGGVFCP